MFLHKLCTRIASWLAELMPPDLAAHIAAIFAKRTIVLDQLPPPMSEIIRCLAIRYPDKVEYALDSAVPELAFRQKAYAQEGEDLVLARIFDGVQSGFYVDIGAHHPMRFSNTYLLYKRGWRGINVDATPGVMAEFVRVRPLDINIQALVSSKEEPQSFYLFNEPALNTASANVVQQRKLIDHQHVIDSVSLMPQTLKSILDEFLPRGQEIDILNVDVEGGEIDVLMSNDWKEYRPKIVIAELLNTSFKNIETNETAKFLSSQSYHPAARFYNSVLFFRAAG